MSLKDIRKCCITDLPSDKTEKREKAQAAYDVKTCFNYFKNNILKQKKANCTKDL